MKGKIGKFVEWLQSGEYGEEEYGEEEYGEEAEAAEESKEAPELTAQQKMIAE